jgi:hypothetical protein
MAALAASGWLAAYEVTPGPTRVAVIVIFVVGLVEPSAFQWRNHPNQAAYIQPLAGGPRAAFARYDLDYWGNCMLQALDRIENAATTGRVRVTGWPMIVLQADITRFPRLMLTGPNDRNAAYFVRLARGDRQELLRQDSASQQLMRVTTADGALLCTAGPTDPLAH